MSDVNALVLPQNAVLLQEDEMRYVDGGYAVNLRRSTVQKGVDLAILVAGTALGGASTIKALVKKIGKKKFVKRVVKVAAKFGIKKAYASKAAEAFSIVTGFSIGGGVAYLLDRYDKTGLNKRVQF